MNLGNPGEFTILQLAEMLCDLIGSRKFIEHQPLPVDDPTRRRPDISLARKLLNWQPTVDLRTGLAATLDWFTTIRLEDYRPPTANYATSKVREERSSVGV